MVNLSRRNFLKVGSAVALALAIPALPKKSSLKAIEDKSDYANLFDFKFEQPGRYQLEAFDGFDKMARLSLEITIPNKVINVYELMAKESRFLPVSMYIQRIA
jgi:hypothetical protein